MNNTGARQLSQSLGKSCLRKLNLAFNPIGDEGANSLAREISNNTNKLQTLILDSCGITFEGLKELTEALATNNTLLELDIEGNLLQPQEASVSLRFTLTERNSMT